LVPGKRNEANAFTWAGCMNCKKNKVASVPGFKARSIATIDPWVKDIKL